MRKSWLRMGLMGVLALLLSGNVLGAERNVMLVLDASGSMWGQIGGNAKISIARDVVRDLLKDWNPAWDLGLIAYGHNRKGDCADIEQLLPVGPLDAAAFNARLAALNPKGKTPMTDAVRKAAEALRYTEDTATVILVSDGVETCNPDPCAVAAELEKSGVDFTAHVIGFDVTDPVAIAQLQCLAGNTGGQYFPARDAGDLRGVLGEVVRQTAAQPPAIQLRATLTPGGEAQPDAQFTLYALDEAGKPGDKVAAYRHDEARPTVALPAGRYRLHVRLDAVRVEQDIEVGPDTPREHEIVLSGAVLNLSAIEQEGGAVLDNTTFQLFPLDASGRRGERVSIGADTKAARFVAPAGRYQLLTTRKDVRRAETLDLVVDTATDHVVLLGAGTLKMRAIAGPGGAPLEQVTFEIYPPDSNERAAIRAATREAEFSLLADRYRAIVSVGAVRRELPVEVLVGQTVEVVADLHAGTLGANAVLAPGQEPLDKTVFEVFPAAGGDRVAIVAYRREATFFLAAGDYRLVASNGATASLPVTVPVAGRVDVTVSLDAGRIEAGLSRGGAPLEGKAVFELFPLGADGSVGRERVAIVAYKPNAQFQVAAGRYMLVVSQGAQGRLEVEVRAGETTAVVVPVE
ncbi:MAG: VWA domain-containing protein [Gammaproteobacteria bacterium]|nr:VWA domain-containing protein [Gammaproteobacteria bacterium]